MKEEARRIAVSLFSCCPRSEVKPCPLWVLRHAAVDALQNNPAQDILPSVAWSAFLLSFLEKIEKAQGAGKAAGDRALLAHAVAVTKAEIYDCSSDKNSAQLM